jgi:hypothetical protein
MCAFFPDPQQGLLSIFDMLRHEKSLGAKAARSAAPDSTVQR